MEGLAAVFRAGAELRSPVLLERLKAFADAFEEAFEFAEDTLETRIFLAKSVVSRLREVQKSADPACVDCVFGLLKALRILCRSRQGVEDVLFTDDGLALALWFAGLAHVEDEDAVSVDVLQLSDVAQAEAMKVLLNQLYNSPDAQAALLKLGGVKAMLREVQYALRVTLRNSMIPKVLRVLAGEESTSAACVGLKELDPFHAISAGLQQFSTGELIEDELRGSCRLPRQLVESSLAAEIVGDLLGLVCSLTMEFGPFASGEPPKDVPKSRIDDLEYIWQIIPLIRSIFLWPSLTDSTVLLKRQSFHALLNLPAVEICKQLDEDVLGSWVDFLRDQCRTERCPGDKELESALVAVLVFLQKVVSEDEKARAFFKERVLPEKLEDEEDDVDLGKPVNIDAFGRGERYFVKQRLAGAMTSHRIALKHCVGEFLFALCDEDANEFIDHIGFGRAAGLLAERGLSAIPLRARQRPARQRAKRDPRPARKRKPDPEEMTEEEKEAEAEKLVRAISRLNELGVIKMIPQGGSFQPPDDDAGSDDRQET